MLFIDMQYAKWPLYGFTLGAVHKSWGGGTERERSEEERDAFCVL